ERGEVRGGAVQLAHRVPVRFRPRDGERGAGGVHPGHGEAVGRETGGERAGPAAHVDHAARAELGDDLLVVVEVVAQSVEGVVAGGQSRLGVDRIRPGRLGGGAGVRRHGADATTRARRRRAVFPARGTGAGYPRLKHGRPAHGGREGTGMRIQGEDLARVVIAGLAAAFLAGLLTLLWTAPEPLPGVTLAGAVVVIGLITAAGYRHAAALAAAGAVLTLLGAAQLYSVSTAQLTVLEEARRLDRQVDELFQGPAYCLLLGCLLLGTAFGWALRRVSSAPRTAQYGLGMV